ncbi:4Fe-4S cluster-binding domain-containing protein, partial [Mycobacterium tuberculosis]|nr:4Fe-4S cluster-binding domain-containing protein [Mycobacterium tuberculosis]
MASTEPLAATTSAVAPVASPQGRGRREVRPAVRGFVHSSEAGGAVDGPGVRFVLFLSGCPLRCQYCHNPDTWHMRQGKDTSSREVLA